MRSHIGALACLTSAVVMGAGAPRRQIAAAGDTVVVQWNRVLLQAVRNTRFAPMLTARALAVTHTCMYDAWTAYDPLADGIDWPIPLRRPRAEHTQASIAVWDCKVWFDFARPITAVRFLYGGKLVRAWAGPGLGTRLIDGIDFRSYIPTPPFAESLPTSSMQRGEVNEKLQ
jgi:hypothetical protein